ncbi:hypothetical protein L1D49_09215, partial [Vibrio diabolicus]|nr:hypothetical protein [Vibrio diabolicus]
STPFLAPYIFTKSKLRKNQIENVAGGEEECGLRHRKVRLRGSAFLVATQTFGTWDCGDVQAKRKAPVVGALVWLECFLDD